MIRFTAYGVAAPKGSTKAFFVKSLGRAIVTADNKRTKPWQQEVAGAAVVAREIAAAEGRAWAVAEDAVVLEVTFYLPRPKSLPKRVIEHCKKPDLDKLLRATKDALTGVLWRDDSQVVSVTGTKAYAGGVFDPLGNDGVPRAIVVAHIKGSR